MEQNPFQSPAIPQQPGEPISVCQACGTRAPTRYVEFYQNIGALVVRFHKSVRGRLCKRCVHKYFWSFTPITLAVGWLGTISIIVAPIFVLNNVGRYLLCLTMPGVPDGAESLRLSDAARARIWPFGNEIAQRINSGQDLTTMATEMAAKTGASPTEIVLFVRSYLTVSRPQPQQ